MYRIIKIGMDVHMIARCLSYGRYHPVYIPTEEDDSVKEYLRMPFLTSRKPDLTPCAKLLQPATR